jgi:hypothetical protein
MFPLQRLHDDMPSLSVSLFAFRGDPRRRWYRTAGFLENCIRAVKSPRRVVATTQQQGLLDTPGT